MTNEAPTDVVGMWVEFLADLEEEVRVANIAMDNDLPINNDLIEPWAPPQHLPALPLELLERAQALNSELNSLQLRVEASQILLKKEMDRVASLKGNLNQSKRKNMYESSTVPLYVDRSV